MRKALRKIIFGMFLGSFLTVIFALRSQFFQIALVDSIDYSVHKFLYGESRRLTGHRDPRHPGPRVVYGPRKERHNAKN